MSDKITKKDAFLTKENIDLIVQQIKEFCELHKEKYKTSYIKGKYVKDALIKTIRHYNSFLKEFNFILETVDFYRTYAWFGYFLALEFPYYQTRFKIARTAIFRIIKELEEKKGIVFTDVTKIEIIKFLQYELEGKGELGVGKNGLYLLGRIVSTLD
ncbi:hypothetical protein PW919_000273 [Campylobacter coli]|uniref:hypothetical protein n=1 Tax=Campylobacter coli TaxID=195 RepID=UPI0012865976|nr:hypothetical protein [Campylobacter coli]EAI9678583.1 hypothetical protein [Campylobacter coli]EAJ8892123.1 hypothetical protein [Campylobacter coli]EAK4065302.1 hypothetical protein [Campylobacter coli]ECL9187642.1 hypothetical protein [Campylobacter coli]ECL9451165.1 hypothetical protein [Campylobacter coli]